MTDRIVCVREWHSSSACTAPVLVLTKRQHQVLLLVSQGLEDKHIARKIGIASSTVKDHVIAACAAIGGRNRAAACTLAVRMGVI